MAEPEKDKVEKLKKELAKLEWEEKILRKRDDRLKWEEEMLQMEEGMKSQRADFIESAPPGMLGGAKKAPEEVALDGGTTYLLLEERPERSISLFTKERKAGLTGLMISRSNPKKMRDKYDMEGVKICWLTGVRAGEQETTIAGLQELSILVSNYIDKNHKSVVLLDGLEYLVSNNEFPIVLRLIQQIRDKVSTSESKMLIPVNPNALDSKQLTLLKRECQVIG